MYICNIMNDSFTVHLSHLHTPVICSAVSIQIQHNLEYINPKIVSKNHIGDAKIQN